MSTKYTTPTTTKTNLKSNEHVAVPPQCTLVRVNAKKNAAGQRTCLTGQQQQKASDIPNRVTQTLGLRQHRPAAAAVAKKAALRLLRFWLCASPSLLPLIHPSRMPDTRPSRVWEIKKQKTAKQQNPFRSRGGISVHV